MGTFRVPLCCQVCDKICTPEFASGLQPKTICSINRVLKSDDDGDDDDDIDHDDDDVGDREDLQSHHEYDFVLCLFIIIQGLRVCGCPCR